MSDFDKDLEWESVELVDGINWNEIEDPMDLEVWNKLTQNLWLPEKIALSNDLNSWNTLSDDEKLSTTRVFTGLTVLDTIQAKVASLNIIPDARTPHEADVLLNIAFMEAVHAKSYSSIFSTLLSSEEIDEAFEWSRNNEFLKKKGALVLKHYRADDPLKKKVLSVLLEGFLFYSGFFMPFWWASKAKLTNTADIIRLILRDESIHQFYLGYKFQQGFKEETEERQKELEDFTYKVLKELYENEVKYAQMIYDPLGITEYVLPYMRYNGNKALMSLGFEPVWDDDETEVLPQILTSLSLDGENHDFFSGGGSTYVMGTAEETTDDDWDF